MRWVVVVGALALGCPPPARYTENRPGLSCDRATRVAYRTLLTLGYTITDVVPASPERTGTIAGTRNEPDGTTKKARVVIACDAKGAVLRPVEDSILSDYDFSRAFGYSFKELVKRPDVEEPRAQRGLEVLVHALTAQEGILDLGGVPTAGGAVAVRVTVRNNTDRAVSLDPSTIDLVPDGEEARRPLAGTELGSALAPGAAGDAVRKELLAAPHRVAPHATLSGYLVYPPAVYREARIGIEDVETGEAEGFVAPVQ